MKRKEKRRKEKGMRREMEKVSKLAVWVAVLGLEGGNSEGAITMGDMEGETALRGG